MKVEMTFISAFFVALFEQKRREAEVESMLYFLMKINP